TKPTQASKGKRIKTSAKGDKPAKNKQSATKSKGLTVLSEVALTVAELMKIALERSKIQTHSSHASGSGADEGTSIKPGVPDVPTYKSDDKQISWKSNDEEDDDKVSLNDDDDDADNQDDDDQEDDGQDDKDQDEVNEKINSDNDGDDFIHPKLSNQDQEIRHNKEESDEEIQGTNVEEEELDEEETNDEDEANELYRDVNSSSVSSGFVSDMLNPSLNTSIDSIFNRNAESNLLIDVSVTTITEPALLSTTTLPLPPTHLITHLLKDEAQAEIADFINKLDDNIKKIIKDQVKEQVKAQVSKILSKIEKTVNEQLKAKVLTRSSNESKTSHVVAANLSELELKKILIYKMESNKSIHKSDAQKNLYKALVDAYESDKLILDTYGETVLFKRRRDEEDKDKEPSARSNRGSKRIRAGKEPESTSAPKKKTSKTTGKSTKGSKSHHKSADESAQAEEPMQTAKDLEEPAHQEFKIGVTED
ncbi:hypothetical protein Tco_1463173, partial [Tanacetum coccineum]